MSPSTSFRFVSSCKPASSLAKLGLQAAVMATLAAAAQAAPKTWDGGGADGNWTTGLNWDLDTAPNALDSLLFDGALNLTTNNDFAANTQFNGLSFSATADAFVLGGNAINLGGDLTDNNTTSPRPSIWRSR